LLAGADDAPFGSYRLRRVVDIAGRGMMSLNAKALGGLLFLLIVMGALLFVPAGTLDYWQAWVFLAVWGALGLAVTVYLMRNDPKLLQRRMHGGPTAEKETSQKIIMWIVSIGFVAIPIVSALDHRAHPWAVPPDAAIAADFLVALGWLLIFLVFKENTFSAATIELAADQKVISSGPYAVVRHPMYCGGLIYLLGIPVALGSWRGLLVVILTLPALIWRLLDEEKFLARNLPGYAEYRETVKYRLVPFVW
jgi:protein-S-isoprenylcysteine O-methyltransferase Ste14